MEKVTVSDAKPLLHQLVKKARDGTPIIITQGHDHTEAAVLLGWGKYQELTQEREGLDDEG